VVLARAIAISILLPVSLLSGCGPSQAQRQAAWLRAFQMDLEVAHDKWEADRADGWFKNNADAMRVLKARYEEVYARWRHPVDPLTHAILSYSVAVASRADRGQIEWDEANRLYYDLEADIARGRRTLPGPAGGTQREAAMLQWWEAYWREHREIYQAAPGNPIDCRVMSVEAQGSLIQCD
jgi:hypothetical protein